MAREIVFDIFALRKNIERCKENIHIFSEEIEKQKEYISYLEELIRQAERARKNQEEPEAIKN